MSHPRVTVIRNPIGNYEAATLRSALGRAGLRPGDWRETTREDPGTEITRQAVADGTDLVVVCGGDGTVRACVTALAGTDVALAVIPGGTGNLLARNIGIPLGLDAAAAVAAGSARRRIDVGSLGDGCFAVMAGMGFDAAFLRGASGRLKSWLGWAAYVVSGLRAMRTTPTVRVDLRLEDGPLIERQARGVLVANVGRLQGGIPVLPGADAGDGLFEVGVLRAARLRDWWGLLWRVTLRRRPRPTQLETWAAARVSVRTDRPLPTQLDGDVGPERDRLDAVVRRSALLLCVAD